jgi:NTE family protein
MPSAPNSNLDPSIALILTGGGAKAAYQVGVLQALAEMIPVSDTSPTPFSILAGTSAGAINASYLAARANRWQQSVGGLKALWENLTLEQVYRTDGFSLTKIALGWISRILFGGKIFKRTNSNFMLDTKPLAELLHREVDFNQMRTLIEQKSLKGVAFTATQYFAGTTVSYFDGHEGAKPWEMTHRVGIRTQLGTEHVMASSAIPIFFPPIEIDSAFYGDGSLKQTTPLSPAIHLGAKKILAVGIRHEKTPEESLAMTKETQLRPPTLAQIAGEVMGSIFLDSLDADIERLNHINKSITELEAKTHLQSIIPLRVIPVLYLRPSCDLHTVLPPALQHFPPMLRFFLKGLGVTPEQGNELITYLSFFQECVQPLIKLGYDDTIARREEILTFLAD